MADSSLKRKNNDESFSIEVRRWKSEFLEISLWVIRIGKKFWFFGKEVALSLGYSEPKDAIYDHIDPEDKMWVEKLLGKNYKKILIKNISGGGNFPPLTFFQNLQGNYLVIKEVGLYSLCVKSRKSKAKPFQKWIFNTIEEIRETGSYAFFDGPIDNPLSLIDKVTGLEKEIKTLKKETKRTCDKETQTQKSVIVLDGSFRDLEEKIVKFFKKTKSSFKETIEEAKLDLEKSIEGAKLDLEKSIEEAKLDLKKSIRKASSSSSSSHSSHRLYYSDSD